MNGLSDKLQKLQLLGSLNDTQGKCLALRLEFHYKITRCQLLNKVLITLTSHLVKTVNFNLPGFMHEMNSFLAKIPASKYCTNHEILGILRSFGYTFISRETIQIMFYIYVFKLTSYHGYLYYLLYYFFKICEVVSNRETKSRRSISQ